LTSRGNSMRSSICTASPARGVAPSHRARARRLSPDSTNKEEKSPVTSATETANAPTGANNERPPCPAVRHPNQERVPTNSPPHHSNATRADRGSNWTASRGNAPKKTPPTPWTSKENGDRESVLNRLPKPPNRTKTEKTSETRTKSRQKTCLECWKIKRKRGLFRAI